MLLAQTWRSLVPLGYSPLYALCYHNIGELQVIQQLIGLRARIHDGHTHLGYSNRIVAMQRGSCHAFTYLQIAAIVANQLLGCIIT